LLTFEVAHRVFVQPSCQREQDPPLHEDQNGPGNRSMTFDAQMRLEPPLGRFAQELGEQPWIELITAGGAAQQTLDRLADARIFVLSGAAVGEELAPQL